MALCWQHLIVFLDNLPHLALVGASLPILRSVLGGGAFVLFILALYG